MNLEDESENVKIGKAIHEEKYDKEKNREIAIDNIKLDKLTTKYLTETKKSDADIEAAKWQLLYYLKVLKSKGIIRKGKLEIVEKNKQNKSVIIVDLTDEIERKLDMIEKEYKSNGFINMKYFSTKNTFDLVAGPITSLTTVSLIVLIVSIIVSIVILTLVIILFLKDRRHEMGIYISLGERKWKILMQIILEVCLVAMISVSFSLVTGFKLGDTIANQVIASSTEKQEEVLESQLAEIGSVNPENLQLEEITSQMSFTMDISYIVSVYCISFVVVLLSSIIPVMYVLRIEPKKILM